MKYNQIILLKFIVSSFIIAASPSETIKKPKLQETGTIKLINCIDKNDLENQEELHYSIPY